MNSTLVDAAFKIVPNQQVLVNMISKRVRQLSAGQRPMIETGPRMGHSDVALQEIIEGKLTWEAAPVVELVVPGKKRK